MVSAQICVPIFIVIGCLSGFEQRFPAEPRRTHGSVGHGGTPDWSVAHPAKQRNTLLAGRAAALLGNSLGWLVRKIDRDTPANRNLYLPTVQR